MTKNWGKGRKLLKEFFSITVLRILFLMIVASILAYTVFTKYEIRRVGDYYTRFNKITGKLEESIDYNNKSRWVDIMKGEKKCVN